MRRKGNAGLPPMRETRRTGLTSLKCAGLIDPAGFAVFTGAGISTESGIPDFRSPGGIWTKQASIDFSDFVGSDNARHDTWRRRFALEPILRQAAPNRGHRAVAELIRSGMATSFITQNIDGLHQDSGIPNDKVIECMEMRPMLIA